VGRGEEQNTELPPAAKLAFELDFTCVSSAEGSHQVSG
jgi:hypothetical protein